ncbi:hypothetical protein OROGR_015323 [Orobanche gracilis]
MMTSWADAVENVATGPSDKAATSGGKEHHPSAHTKPAYVPPHLRNRPPASNPPPPSFGGPPFGNGKSAYGGSSGSQWANNSRFDYGRQGYGGGVRGGRGGWGSRDREVNPFGNDDVDVEVEPVFGSGFSNLGASKSVTLGASGPFDYKSNGHKTRNVHHAGQPMPGEEQEDIVMTSTQSILRNVKCPLTGKPVTELDDPVRSLDCKHIYEKKPIMRHITSKSVQGSCPVAGCPKKLQADRVVCDPLLLIEIDEMRTVGKNTYNVATRMRKPRLTIIPNLRSQL